MSLDAWIEEQRKAFEVPGLAVAVVHNGKTVLSQGFGLRDVAKGLAVTPDTAFATASMTKAFTAAGVGALVDDGMLEWDTPVREYLPNFQMHDHVATECMSSRDLLCHRSGLPRHDLVWYGNTELSRADIVARLRHLQPNKSFRSTWQYNNLMYVTAGHLCEVLTAKSWEKVMRERIFERAGMGASTFSEKASAAIGEVALPYARRRGEVVLIPYEPVADPDVSGPAGSIFSTLTDLERWLHVNLDKGRLGEAVVLSEDTVRQQHAPQMVMSESTIFPEVYDSAYGLGWFIGNYRGHKCVHHGGNIDGFTSLLTMLPNDGIGVVILANKAATSIRAAISYHVFDELLGLDHLPWDQRCLGLENAALAGAKEAKSRAERVEGSTPGHRLEEYAGSYEHPAYGRFEIEHVDGKLQPTFRAMSIEMIHRHFDVFDLEMEELENSQLAATFNTAGDGSVSSFTLPIEASVDPIVFTRLPEPMPAPEICERLAGTFEMGPIEIKVEFTAPDKLTASVPGAGTVKLLPHRGLTFNVEGLQGASATFVLNETGEATELVVQPMGVLKRKSDDA